MSEHGKPLRARGTACRRAPVLAEEVVAVGQLDALALLQALQLFIAQAIRHALQEMLRLKTGGSARGAENRGAGKRTSRYVSRKQPQSELLFCCGSNNFLTVTVDAEKLRVGKPERPGTLSGLVCASRSHSIARYGRIFPLTRAAEQRVRQGGSCCGDRWKRTLTVTAAHGIQVQDIRGLQRRRGGRRLCSR